MQAQKWTSSQFGFGIPMFSESVETKSRPIVTGSQINPLRLWFRASSSESGGLTCARRSLCRENKNSSLLWSSLPSATDNSRQPFVIIVHSEQRRFSANFICNFKLGQTYPIYREGKQSLWITWSILAIIVANDRDEQDTWIVVWAADFGRTAADGYFELGWLS